MLQIGLLALDKVMGHSFRFDYPYRFICQPCSAAWHSQRELFPKFRNKSKFGRWEEMVVQLLLAMDVNYVAPDMDLSSSNAR